MPSKKPTTAPRAEYLASLTVTPVIESFADYIERETGTTLTERERVVLYLGSALRGDFQKSPENQQRLAEQAARVTAEKNARSQRAATRAAAPKVEKVAKPKPTPTTAAASTKPRRRPLKVEVTA